MLKLWGFFPTRVRFTETEDSLLMGGSAVMRVRLRDVVEDGTRDVGVGVKDEGGTDEDDDDTPAMVVVGTWVLRVSVGTTEDVLVGLATPSTLDVTIGTFDVFPQSL